MDFFTEFIIERKKTTKDYLLIASIIVAGLIIIYIGSFFANILGQFFLLFILAIVYGAYFLISRMSIEFEYSLFNGELEIDRIRAKRKRKRIITIEAKNIDLFAPLNHEKTQSALNQKYQLTIHAEGEIGSPDVYVAFLTHKGRRTCIYIQPSEKILEGLQNHMSRTKFYRS